MRKLLLIVLSLTFFVSSATAQNDGSEQNQIGQGGTFAITNARIVTVSGAEIPIGTLIIKEGKIAAVGAGVSIPSDAKKIDGTGLTVYPGMIDAGTNMGLVEIGDGVEGTVDTAETGEFNPNAKAILGFNPHSAHINVTRVNGITMVQSLPTGSAIAGQSTVVNLNGATQDEIVVTPEFGLVVNFPTVNLNSGFNPVTGFVRLDPAQAMKRRDDRLKAIKDQFAAAEQYAKAKDAAAKDPSIPMPNSNLKMEALIPYVRGERPVIFAAGRSREIKGALKFAEELKLKPIILGGMEAWKEADALKKQGVPVIYTEIYTNPGADDPYDLLFEVPSMLSKAGVKFAISTGESGANVRDLPYQAGMASAYGLSKDEALKSVTLYPAQILGVADKVGSLDVGKVANIVVTDGDLLEVKTNVKYVFIGGREIPLTSRHTELFDSFKDRKLPAQK